MDLINVKLYGIDGNNNMSSDCNKMMGIANNWANLGSMSKAILMYFFCKRMSTDVKKNDFQ